MRLCHCVSAGAEPSQIVSTLVGALLGMRALAMTAWCVLTIPAIGAAR
jgi:hypothetical protein